MTIRSISPGTTTRKLSADQVTCPESLSQRLAYVNDNGWHGGTVAPDSCISVIREFPPGRRWAGDLGRAKKCRGFWMRTLCGSSSGQSVSRHRHALPSREILFLGSGTAQTVCAGGWVDGCVILEQQASTEVQGSPRSRSSRPETLPCSIWRCISGET